VTKQDKYDVLVRIAVALENVASELKDLNACGIKIEVRNDAMSNMRGTRAKMTPDFLAVRIRACKVAHPRWTQQRIAKKFNVTNARVSYALRGGRG
jgi:hypothetical protein